MEQEKTLEQLDFQELRKMMVGQYIIKDSDMQEDMKQDAADTVVSGIENNMTPTFNAQNAAKFIKDSLDKKFGPTWQCIIGEGYAYDVTV